MRNIKIIVSGIEGAGTSTVAQLISERLKLIFPDSRIFNADQDTSLASPVNLIERIDVLNTEGVNIVIDTRQDRPEAKIDWNEQVKTFLNDDYFKKVAPFSATPYFVIQRLGELAEAVGLENWKTKAPANLYTELQSWLTKPAKMASLEKREKEDGDNRQGKRSRKAGNFGLGNH